MLPVPLGINTGKIKKISRDGKSNRKFNEIKIEKVYAAIVNVKLVDC